MKAYSAHSALIDPARPSASLLRLFGGMALIVVGVLALNFGLFQMLAQREDWSSLYYEVTEGTTARGMLLMLGTFVIPVAVLWVTLEMIHRRTLRSLIGPAPDTVRDFFRTFANAILLFLAVMLIPMPEAFGGGINQPFLDWLLILPIGLGVLFIQIAAEELLFRGYLQSQLAARFNHPIVWMVLPSVIFGLLHLSTETYGSNAWPIAIWAMVFGMMAADLTARAGNLGPALALHFANNITSILIFGMKDHWNGLALMEAGFGPQDTDILANALLLEAPVLLCLWLVGRIAIKR